MAARLWAKEEETWAGAPDGEEAPPEEAGTDMSAAEYRGLIRVLGLTFVGAGEIFGWSPSQTFRYASGRALPAPTRKLLRAAREFGLPLDRISKL
jgi:hypothetical protein